MKIITVICAVLLVTVSTVYAQGLLDREEVRGAAGGALSGALVSKASGGSGGEGALWGMGIGAVRGMAAQRQKEQQQQMQQMQMQQAYEAGRRDASGYQQPNYNDPRYNNQQVDYRQNRDDMRGQSYY